MNSFLNGLLAFSGAADQSFVLLIVRRRWHHGVRQLEIIHCLIGKTESDQTGPYCLCAMWDDDCGTRLFGSHIRQKTVEFITVDLN